MKSYITFTLAELGFLALVVIVLAAVIAPLVMSLAYAGTPAGAWADGIIAEGKAWLTYGMVAVAAVLVVAFGLTRLSEYIAQRREE